MADYTSPDEIALLAGHTGVDLRTDDDDPDGLVAEAISYATGEIDFAAQGKYSAIDQIQWVRNVATHFALEWLSLRRLNSVTASLAKTCDRYREKLALVEAGKLQVPGATRSRRAVTVTNLTTDLRRANNQQRVDRTRSTGTAKGYVRPVDTNAPDDR